MLKVHAGKKVDASTKQRLNPKYVKPLLEIDPTNGEYDLVKSAEGIWNYLYKIRIKSRLILLLLLMVFNG